MKNILKYVMLLLLIFLCSSGLGTSNIESIIHEWAGILLFACVLLHLIQNRKWFKALITGKYNLNRLSTVIIDLALIVILVLIILSSLVISKFIFSNVNIINISLARRIHLSLTAWLFIICCVHYGMHQNFMKKNTIINSILIIIGIAIFVYLRFYERLFLLSEFPYMPFEESWKLYILNIIMSLGFISLGMILNKLIKSKK